MQTDELTQILDRRSVISWPCDVHSARYSHDTYAIHTGVLDPSLDSTRTSSFFDSNSNRKLLEDDVDVVLRDEAVHRS